MAIMAMTATWCVSTCGLNPLMVYFDVNIRYIWKGNMITRCEISSKNIRSLGFRDMREGVALRGGVILRSLECA